jgi:hypothetical protein
MTVGTSDLMRTRVLTGIVLAAALAPGAVAAGAAPVPTLGSTGFKPEYRLSQTEIDRILATAASKPSKVDPERDGPIDPGIRGEIGFGIGTGGYRSAFGTAFYPLGSSGGAMISFDFDLFGNDRRR